MRSRTCAWRVVAVAAASSACRRESAPAREARGSAEPALIVAAPRDAGADAPWPDAPADAIASKLTYAGPPLLVVPGLPAGARIVANYRGPLPDSAEPLDARFDGGGYVIGPVVRAGLPAPLAAMIGERLALHDERGVVCTVTIADVVALQSGEHYGTLYGKTRRPDAVAALGPRFWAGGARACGRRRHRGPAARAALRGGAARRDVPARHGRRRAVRAVAVSVSAG